MLIPEISISMHLGGRKEERATFATGSEACHPSKIENESMNASGQSYFFPIAVENQLSPVYAFFSLCTFFFRHRHSQLANRLMASYQRLLIYRYNLNFNPFHCHGIYFFAASVNTKGEKCVTFNSASPLYLEGHQIKIRNSW